MGWPENAQPVGTEFVHHTGRQGRLGADHGQADAIGLRPLAQGHHVGDGHVLQAGVACRAGVARGHKHLGGFGRLFELPGQRVFAAATTYHENLHGFFQNAALWEMA